MSASTMMNNNMIQTQGIEEETMMMLQKKQSIVTILGLGCDDSYSNTDSVPNSLRRTLSADMSSKNWSSPLKKIASSEELFPHNQIKKTIADSSSSSEEDYEERKEIEAEEAEADAERERLAIWSAIQRNKKEEQEKLSSTWGSIMSLKGDDNNNNNNSLEISKSLPATPYVHPLVKRTKSCSLSLKSLEICTENLGSETGSDGLLFSPFPKSESGESKTEQQQEKAKASDSSSACELLAEEKWYNNHAAAATKKSSLPRSFPPPLPSLSFHQAKGSSLHMRPHRDNGRLVLEAMSLPSQNNFNAQRQNGRLVLTFAKEEEQEEIKEENYDDEGVDNEDSEEEFGNFNQEEKEQEQKEEYDDESEEEEEEEVEDVESVITTTTTTATTTTTTTSTTNNRRMALMMNRNKQIGLVNRNPNWSEKFNKGVNFEDVNVVEKEPAMANSLPPRPRVARLIPSLAAQAVASAATSGSASLNMNAYEYYWRTKPTPPDDQNNKVIVSGANNQTPGGQQQLLVVRGRNGDYLVHNFKNCKDSRRPLLFWEPYCIATS